MIYPKIYNKEELKLFEKMIDTELVYIFNDINIKNKHRNAVYITNEGDKNGKYVVIAAGNGEIGTYEGGEDYVLCEMDLFDLYFKEGLTGIKAETFAGKNIVHCLLSESMEELGEYAFAECSHLESIIIPEGLKYIRKGAFEGCENLKEIILPSTIKSIGEDTFKRCKNITVIINKPEGSLTGSPWGTDNANIVWEENDGIYITEDNELLFRFLGNCKEYAIPDGIKKINSQAFSGSKPEKIIIPDSLEKIGTLAFEDSPLKEIIGGKGIRELAPWAFARCQQLSKIHIPFGVEVLEGTFIRCVSLEKVTLPDSIKKLRKGVFSGCCSLKELYIPDSVDEMEGNCFSFILIDEQTESKIKRLEVDKNNKNFLSENGVIFNKDKSRLVCASTIGGKSFTVPDTVKSIDSAAFSVNLNWEKIIVPNDVIADNNRDCSFFKNINIDCVEIPASMYEKEFTIFHNCKIKQLVIKGAVQTKEKIRHISYSCEIDEIIFE